MKRKKIKIHYGNLFLVICLVVLLGGGIYFLYNQFNDNDEKIENNSNEEKDFLSDLGYSKSEIKAIRDNLNDEEISKIDKKYENLSDYVKVKYFHIENIDRYDALKDKSDYEVSEIIMRVNTDLDHDYYTDIKTVKDPDDPLVLVNKYHALPNDYEPTDLISVGSNQTMKREAGEAFLKMLDDIHNEGMELWAASGYRSISYQRDLYNGYVANYGVSQTDTFSARAGHSEHHTGLAIDVTQDGRVEKDFEETAQFQWLQENAHKYGFIMRYPNDKIYMTGYDYEPWHYRYVGVEIATLIKNEGITYEEYCVKYLGLY